MADPQIVLTDEQLQEMVVPQVRQWEGQIHNTETKAKLTRHDQRMLGIYRRNLEVYQQVLIGKRPYAPLNLLNEITALEEDLKNIDIELARFQLL